MVSEIVLGAPILWASIVIPFIGGLSSALAGNRMNGRQHTAINSATWLISLVLVVYASIILYTSGANTIIDPGYGKVPGIGWFALFLDGVSAALAISIATVSLGIAAYSYHYMKHRFEELGVGEPWGTYFILYQLFTIGMLGVVYANNTILFYLFLEITLIPSFLLIVLYGYGDRVRIGLLYLVWTHVGAALYLIGSLLIGFTTTFDYYVPGIGYTVNIEASMPAIYAIIAFVLLVVGLTIKGALFGFHMWLPYAHAEAPTPISALLSPLLIGLGLYGLFRIVYGFFPGLWSHAAPVLIAWAFITMIYGGFLAYTQNDVKRFLAYSSISQMGYLMLGLATTSYAGIAGSMFHYVTHAFGKAVLFGIAGVLIVTAHTRDMNKMGGLAGKLPYAAALALLGFLHITGIPPTMGLWSEYLIARGLAEWSAGHGTGVFVTALVLFMTAVAISTVYSFVGFKRIFLSEPGEAYKHVSMTEPSVMIASLAFLGILGVFFFVFPTPVLDVLVKTVRGMYVLKLGGG
ncbi:MAG: complex I subunit 5 family protein [Pyrodictiaceae archaeon]